MSRPAGQLDFPKEAADILKAKPVRDALSDISTLRREMSVLHDHGQYAAPERILRLTAKIDALIRRLVA